MTEADAITLSLAILQSAALSGVVFGFIIWFFARPER